MSPVVRAARPDEAAALSDLALRSKAHWGYDEAFLRVVRAELTYRPGEIAARRTAVAERHGVLLGFCTVDGEPPEGELGNLFVDPPAIGTGVGRLLWQHAVRAAAAAGFAALLIESDPQAEGFYAAMGAERVGAVPSGSIPGRSLPLLRYRLPG
jgi:GNAT superfamily N-acetyltransferase